MAEREPAAEQEARDPAAVAVAAAIRDRDEAIAAEQRAQQWRRAQEAELVERRAEVARLTNDVEGLRQTNAALAGQLETERTGRRDVEGALAGVRGELERVQGELARERQALADLRARVEGAAREATALLGAVQLPSGAA